MFPTRLRDVALQPDVDMLAQQTPPTKQSDFETQQYISRTTTSRQQQS